MPDPTSRSEYDARMHRVLAHIDRHLDQPLELDALADVAHFSRFHFHRVFTAWSGETVADYVRRRRLEIAATKLASQPRLTVLSVALSVGFTAPEAFTRAFRLRFGVSPSAWRDPSVRARIPAGTPSGTPAGTPVRMQERNLSQAHRNPDQAATWPEAHGSGTTSHTEHAMPTMSVTVLTREPTSVVYMRYTGAYGPGIAQFWQSTVAPWMAANNLMGYPRYGVSLDDPAVTAPDQCRYDACVEVPVDITIGSALRATLPGGRYAVLHYDGPLAKISGAWDAVLRDWLPQSGMQLDHRPMFERYGVDQRYDPRTGIIQCDICIPVAPL